MYSAHLHIIIFFYIYTFTFGIEKLGKSAVKKRFYLLYFTDTSYYNSSVLYQMSPKIDIFVPANPKLEDSM